MVSDLNIRMIFIGLDDTDTLDTPGTNQLARHLVRELRPWLRARMILRHQLLEDPRVPCTRKNGCASIEFEVVQPLSIEEIAARLRGLVLDWIPARSDPGFAIAEAVPAAISEWGLRAKRELLTQREARQLAAEQGVHLEGLAGTQDGVIGALAAIGLMATRNDGRVVFLAEGGKEGVDGDVLDVSGKIGVTEIHARGIDSVIECETNQPIIEGTIDVTKKLRPNLREGRVVLFAERRLEWGHGAVKVT